MSEDTLRVVQAVTAVVQAEDIVVAMADEAESARVLEQLAHLAEPGFETVFIGPPHLGSAELSYTGPQGFREGWLEWTEPYSSFRIEIQEVIDGPDAVVVVVRQVAETKTGGVAIEQQASSVWWVRDGKLRRVEFHLDHDSALQAAGLA
jgi:ketosteroid isomerase-like protein